MAPLDLGSKARFARHASIKYQLRQTVDPHGFLQSSVKAKEHVVLHKSKREWPVYDTVQGRDMLVAKLTKVSVRTEQGAKEELQISRETEACAVYVDGAEVAHHCVHTVIPDASVRINNVDYIYHCLKNIPEYPPGLEGYNVRTEIGKGGEAVVMLASCNATGRAVAIKGVRLHIGSFHKLKDDIRRWEGFIHPNLARLMDWCREASHVYFVSPLARFGSLHDYVEQEGKLSEDLAQPVIAQVIEGLLYLHGEGFLHADVKPDNVLVFDKDRRGVLTVKMSDFGLTIPTDKDPDRIIGMGGTANWAPPEVKRGMYNERSDAYGVGGIMFFVLFRKMVFHINPTLLTLEARLAGRRFQIEDISTLPVTAEARETLGGLLENDHGQRWSLRKARDARWLRTCVLPPANVGPLPFSNALSQEMAAKYQEKNDRRPSERITFAYEESQVRPPADLRQQTNAQPEDHGEPRNSYERRVLASLRRQALLDPRPARPQECPPTEVCSQQPLTNANPDAIPTRTAGRNQDAAAAKDEPAEVDGAATCYRPMVLDPIPEEGSLVEVEAMLVESQSASGIPTPQLARARPRRAGPSGPSPGSGRPVPRRSKRIRQKVAPFNTGGATVLEADGVEMEDGQKRKRESARLKESKKRKTE
ncbi:kinase-like protein [Punctularia strigosozonata HHB-11173 SS5]|uniref:Kinase-like protein n=1 Tax=Punctularia strigosozonata (strain HHB-11173) TaxID=741275 RepID=R7S1B4_PUNST|nr:kinase-like protein [Punctularia strigosozonata HHB-11173 SS5]EIN04165.1 kinase-like protein [Punctularia strigosozonata HHB-11173 SS5]